MEQALLENKIVRYIPLFIKVMQTYKRLLYEAEQQVKTCNKPAVMQQSEQLHIAQLIMGIEEFLEPLHPIRHSNSFLKLKAMCNCQ